LKQSNRYGTDRTILPLKFVGVVNYTGHRERVRIAIRHDTGWDQHISRSWNNPKYWYHKTGGKKLGTLQLADLIIEWRFGRSGTPMPVKLEHES
jgi:hypothetical protein